MERNIIQEIMDTQKISLRELARELDYDVALLSRIRNRERTMSHRMAYRISEIYNLKFEEIVKVERIE